MLYEVITVFQDRGPPCPRGGHHQVLGPGDRFHVEVDRGPDKPVGPGLDIPLLV